jgi:hypothetical protein
MGAAGSAQPIATVTGEKKERAEKKRGHLTLRVFVNADTHCACRILLLVTCSSILSCRCAPFFNFHPTCAGTLKPHAEAARGQGIIGVRWRHSVYPSHHSSPAHGPVIHARAHDSRYRTKPSVRTEGYSRGGHLRRAFGGDRPAACPRELRQRA